MVLEKLQTLYIKTICLGQNNTEIVNLLLKNGAEANLVAKDKESPLLLAVRKGS